MKYLLVFDIDGTLVEPKEQINLTVIQLLRKLQEKAKIAIASGKNISYIAGFARGIGLTDFIAIGENGAVIFFPENFEEIVLVKRPSFIDDLKTMVAKYFAPDIWFQPNKVQLTIFPKRPELIDPITSFLANQIQALGIKDKVVLIKHVDAIDILPASVNKGEAVGKVREILGIGKENVICVGDNENDIPMFEEAGISILIGNKINYSKITLKFSNIVDCLEYLLTVI